MDLQPDALVGQMVDGRYLVQARLARGGMATVYQALDVRLDRVVALKVMHRHLAEDPDFVARFQREARAAARLAHPHVVGVFDQGAADGLVYLAMEYVPGRTLRDILREFGPLTPEQALVLLDPILEGLAAAHAAGFVHRDIKPENVLVSDDGRVKVADFGLARAVATSNTSATQGVLIGTVAYLSPEQVESGEADERSDIYAAGILLFEMVTGQVPHAGASPLSVAYQHVNQDVQSPSALRSDIPADVDALVITATRRMPSQRYQNTQDFLADVRRVRAVLPSPRPFTDIRTTLVVDASTNARLNAGAKPPQQPAPAPASIAVAGTQAPRRRLGRRSWALIGLAIATALAVLGGVLLSSALGHKIPTPSIVGQSVDQARVLLAKSGLSLEVSGEVFSESIPASIVISSDPEAGADIKEQSAVAVTVSKGPERYTIPATQGQSVEAATAALSALPVEVGTQVPVFDNTAPAGTIAGTRPAAGSEVKRGSSVDLLVSKGPEPVQIPELIGKKQQGATAALKSLGLDADITRTYSESVAKGRVMSATPGAGTTVNSGTSVELIVSDGPPPVVVPKLIDMRRRDAIAALTRLGLKAKVISGQATPLNRVYSQNPAAGTEIPKGSTVTISVI
ncbi:MAG: Stk1 family PASTA domain-containing Ser/Thr kinase [Actinomycetota bacterium]|nr:Stk1 family PASTA domain-containing Ser/Thr kinase [Actinomycetota bacterium]MDP2289028.1 Stk1 family PASTA domain-containing Ser/Thr kinase [Actinomycetota bacterium]